MKCRPNLSLLVGFGLVCFLTTSCDDPTRSVNSNPGHIIEPGFQYRVEFDNPVDSLASGQLFEGISNLAVSPMEPMYQKPLIIKADDLLARISPNWRSFIRWADSHSYALSLGLICNSLAGAPAADLKYLRNLNRWQNELWLHGWDHEVGNNVAEFAGHSLAYQTTHLKESIRWTEAKLGLELRTFGPPGNRFDSFTSAAFLANPQLKVWFHNDDSLNLPYVIKIRWIAESSTGVLRPFDQFREELRRNSDDDVIILQVHPAGWEESDLRQFQEMVDYALETFDLRLTTPYAYYTWRYDKANPVVEKVSETEYIIDCTSLLYPHQLELVAEPAYFTRLNPSGKILDE